MNISADDFTTAIPLSLMTFAFIMPKLISWTPPIIIDIVINPSSNWRKPAVIM